MVGDQAGGESEQTGTPKARDAASGERRKTGLDDPRALDILTTEHWSLLSSRSLGYQEMFGRATTFIAILSGTLVALALLAQATRFGRETLSFALVLFAVCLFIGLATFVRSVAINYEDARWVAGMNRLRRAYFEIVPEVEPFFVTEHEAGPGQHTLAHGSPQRFRNLSNSLTTTSAVVAALDSALAGSLASDVGALLGVGLVLDLAIGAAVSLVSAALHLRYAADFRRRHDPEAKPPL
jgi:hypothetical protein